MNPQEQKASEKYPAPAKYNQKEIARWEGKKEGYAQALKDMKK